MGNAVCRLLGQNRGSLHDRDARINYKRDVLPTVLTNTAWMDLAQGKHVRIHKVCWGNKQMDSSNLDELNNVTSQTTGWGLKTKQDNISTGSIANLDNHL